MHIFHPIHRQIQIEAIISAYNVIRPKDFFFAGEMHDFWELVLVNGGHAIATADERLYRLDAGKLIFHKPMEFHRIWSDQQTEPHLMIISFRVKGDGMQRFKNACYNLTLIEQEQFAQITDSFMQTLQYAADGDKARYSLSSNLSAVLLENFLLQLSRRDVYPNPKLSQDEAQYSNIVSIMKKNCECSLSLEKLAELCQMSVSNLKRIFALYSDVAPAKYFLTLKLRRAMQLLENGMPANQVAEQLDFSGTNYFYTVFKREIGMTPQQYLQSKQKR